MKVFARLIHSFMNLSAFFQKKKLISRKLVSPVDTENMLVPVIRLYKIFPTRQIRKLEASSD